MDNPEKYIALKNEKYGSDMAQRADIYLPAGRSAATKVVILLHGGAWSSGDKTDLDDFIRLIQHLYPELAIINSNYRLAGPAAYHPAQINDIQILLDYITLKTTSWNIGTSYSVGGMSAGAHLAMLYAYKYDSAQKIKAVISVAGPTYFPDPYYLSNLLFQPVITNFMGKPVSNTAGYQDASPAHVVTAAAPPTYMAYGGLDPLVPVSNATLLDQKLTQLNVPHQYDLFPHEGHKFSWQTYDTVARKMVDFLKKYQ